MERVGEEVATVAASGVVVVEGTYTARPALRGYLDLIVVVEAPRKARIARMLARGDSPELIARRQTAEDWYFEHQDPRRGADLVVAGT